jgi:pimeloyl-ACP methyl ester carboxylesterase
VKRWTIRVVLLLTLTYVLGSLLALPPYALRVPSNLVTTSPADVGIPFEDIVIRVDGFELAGWWIPAQTPVATMVFLHGAGANRTSAFFNSLAFYRAMHDLRINVVAFDHRHHGNSSRGPTPRLGMGDPEWRDAAAVMAWLDTNAQAVGPRIIAGVSMGGATAIQALAHGSSADAAVLFDPALDNQDALAQGAVIFTGLPASLFRLYAWSAQRFWGLPKNDGFQQGLELTTPTLIIQDSDDPITRLPFAQALAEANPSIQITEVPKIAQGSACIANKGRWATHAAGFACHPNWAVEQVSEFLNHALGLNLSLSRATLHSNQSF